VFFPKWLFCLFSVRRYLPFASAKLPYLHPSFTYRFFITAVSVLHHLLLSFPAHWPFLSAVRLLLQLLSLLPPFFLQRRFQPLLKLLLPVGWLWQSYRFLSGQLLFWQILSF